MVSSISKYFTGIGAKRLSEVEVSPNVSNQHEFNGIAEFKEIFGAEKLKFDGKFILLDDDEDRIIESNGNLTWYDARENNPNRTEYRLYYTANPVMNSSNAGDLVVIGKVSGEKLVVIVAPSGSTSEQQIMWLFGLSEVGNKFIIKNFENSKDELGYAGNYIIKSLGFETEEPDEDHAQVVYEIFGKSFPSTSEFSAYARSTLKDVSPIEEPDLTLLKWMEREEFLFKSLEKYIVQEKLRKGFGKDGIDVDDFIQFSLSVQNRRKSRAGFAFEHHLSKIFDSYQIHYSKGKVTELNKKPDFIFPNIQSYRDKDFNTELLTMLGLKTSAKDRWRQVLSEAARLKRKNLITLEPSISQNQTDEMAAENLQLVVPTGIIETYSPVQRKQILNLKEFIDILLERQKRTQA